MEPPLENANLWDSPKKTTIMAKSYAIILSPYRSEWIKAIVGDRNIRLISFFLAVLGTIASNRAITYQSLKTSTN